jgi:hypothetical protein
MFHGILLNQMNGDWKKTVMPAAVTVTKNSANFQWLTMTDFTCQ